jgi:hypothetical protein
LINEETPSERMTEESDSRERFAKEQLVQKQLAQDSSAQQPVEAKRSAPDDKPLRVLSTSLGIALLANAFLVTGAAVAETASNSPANSGSAADEPQLVAWSTDAVKAYFDKNVDWSIPLPKAGDDKDKNKEQLGATGGGSSSGGTTVINNYGSGYQSGFGWDDLLLYHLLFNSGSNYSSSGWYNNHPGYYAGTSTPYKPRSYTSDTFQNKPVAGSVARPKTSTSTGSFTSRSTSSKAGGIGGNSSGISSSSGSSSGSFKSSGSGGFGG